MSSQPSHAASYRLAVIMQCTALANRWVERQWEAKGVVVDPSPEGAPPKRIVQTAALVQVLFPGREVRLQRHEAEGYYLNITSRQPKVFVLWRMREELAWPQLLSVSYNEGARWADSGETVDGVPLPAELLPWVAQFVEEHYEPEPPKARRYASNKDRGRMGHVE